MGLTPPSEWFGQGVAIHVSPGSPTSVGSDWRESPSPAFWAASGAPASHHRRGQSVVVGRSVTTPMARRRPPSEPGQPVFWVLPVECPVPICAGAPRCREIFPAQIRTRHVPVERVFHPVRVEWCHLLHCSAVSVSGVGKPSVPINATGGSGELVTCAFGKLTTSATVAAVIDPAELDRIRSRKPTGR